MTQLKSPGSVQFDYESRPESRMSQMANTPIQSIQYKAQVKESMFGQANKAKNNWDEDEIERDLNQELQSSKRFL